ncbi:MAG: hypothetical protein AAGD25_18155 [Cyanobacteria bacterium P01_F01_bin.150]
MAALVFARNVWKGWSKYIVGAILSAIVAPIVVSLIWQGIFYQIMGHLAIAVFIAPVTLCIAIVTGIWWRWKRSPLPRRMTKWAIAITLFLGLQAVLSIPTCIVISYSYLQHAKAYCDKLVPLLQTYHTENGEYPETLSQLGDIPKAPRLLKQHLGFYYSNGYKYRFSIDDPQIWGARWWLANDATEWEYHKDL